MFKIFKGIRLILNHIGIFPQTIWINIIGLSWFIPDFFNLIRQKKESQVDPWKISLYPILTNKYESSGSVRTFYFLQDLYVSNLIFKNNPIRHIDIGSRIDGFVAQVASYREIEIYDIRPLEDKIWNIKFTQANLMENNEIDITDSISCLHTIEHFGLGRYNDPIDYEGYLKGLNTIYSMLQTNGVFYFSTPIGIERISFNAHRVFSIQRLLDIFKDQYTILDFSYIDDNYNFHQSMELNPSNISTSFDCKTGCGIFVLQKI
jgi:hypothetical protein